MKKMLFVVLIFCGLSWAEDVSKFPLGIGGGYTMWGLDDHPYLPETEFMPYVELKIMNFGLTRVGYSRQSMTQIIDGEPFERIHSSWSLEGFLNLNPGWENPYLSFGYVDRSILDDSKVGDLTWGEWKVALGGKWPVHPSFSLYAQGEYRWSEEEIESAEGVIFSAYNVINFTVGFSTFFY